MGARTEEFHWSWRRWSTVPTDNCSNSELELRTEVPDLILIENLDGSARLRTDRGNQWVRDLTLESNDNAGI
jgi:hypothetical protein